MLEKLRKALPGLPFKRVTFRGRLMDRKTMAFLQAMEERLGYELTVVQGCYNAGGVAASAGTHDKGGVVDLAPWDWERKVRVAKDLGAFVWHRPAIPGLWGEHIHLGVIKHGNLAAAAVRQVAAFLARLNGLANNGPDPSYRPNPPVVFKYPVKTKPKGPQPNNVTKARDALAEAHHALSQAAALLAETPEHRTAAQGSSERADALAQNVRDLLENTPKR